MSFKPQLKIAATYMRGGTSKGVFFNLTDLPIAAQQAGETRDALLLRVIGSPDPYAKQTDGMGGATSSTSKTAILSKSEQVNHDVDYLFGQVDIDKPVIDWSGNCGNLTAAVGAFAISNGLVERSNIPDNGIAIVRIWQANINKTIVAHIPMSNGEVQETGDFELDGVTFPAAEVLVEFMSPADKNAAMFPTGNIVDDLILPETVTEFALRELSSIKATMINVGIPTIFVNAADIGFNGSELQAEINNDPAILAFFEQLRAHGAVQMGLINHVDDAKQRQHTPKIAFVAPPSEYVASSGKQISAKEMDLQVRALSMGKLHHAMMGTAAVAIAVAAEVKGSLVNIASGDKTRNQVVFGHPSGTLKVGAETCFKEGHWQVQKASMSRSARVLMEGYIRVPDIIS